ncbi:MAG: diaminopimelate decarboxylase [Alphaproteobacteria bacterium]
MDEFVYRDGQLMAEDVSLARLASEVGTPFYCYSTAAIRHAYGAFEEAFRNDPVTLCFAVKANSNLSVLRLLAGMGAGADVVSGGELARALEAGMLPERIVFSGVGKTRAEIRQAIEIGVLQINVESVPELEAISAVAEEAGKSVDIALRINPDVDARTHAKITTGMRENKFGITMDQAMDAYAAAIAMPGVRPVGVAVHIGSQLLGLAPFRHAFTRVADFVTALRATGLTVSRVDLGGGLGVRYDEAEDTPPAVAAYADVVRTTMADLDCEIVLEPGRALVGNAGVMVTRVEYVKESGTRNFVIVDAAMNDLLRPALYDAYHAIQPVSAPADPAHLKPVDVVGPVCETGDAFATGRLLPETAAGDLLAIRSAGAYGAVMASNYNTRPRAPEILVEGDNFAIIRPREEVADLLAADRFAPWLEARPRQAVPPKKVAGKG